MADPVSMLIMAAIQVGVSFLFPAQGPRLKDLSMSASTYGNVIPQVFGECRVPANMIWSAGIKEHKHKSFMGKGFAQQYTYTCSFAMALCQGPVQAIRRIWADGKLIYDTTGQSQNVNNYKYRMAFYLGTAEQMPDPTIQADKAELTPAYRNRCYIVFEDISLTDFGNRIPQLAVEVLVQAPASTPPVINWTWQNNSGTIQDAPLLVDMDRGYFYAQGIFNSVMTLRRFNMSDGVENRQQPMPDGYSLIAICPNGDLVAGMGLANSTPIALIDGNTLQTKATVGSFLGPGWSGFAECATMRTSNGDEYFGGYDLFGRFGVAETDSAAAFQFGINNNIPNGAWISNTDTFRVAGRDNHTTLPDFYLGFCDGSVITVTKYFDGHLAVELTNPNPGQSFGLDALRYDVGQDGCLIFWNSQDVHFVSMYKEDSQSVIWTTALPAIPYVSNNTNSRQNIDTNVYPIWSANGKIYVIDTTNGEFINYTPPDLVLANEDEQTQSEYMKQAIVQGIWTAFNGKYGSSTLTSGGSSTTAIQETTNPDVAAIPSGISALIWSYAYDAITNSLFYISLPGAASGILRLGRVQAGTNNVGFIVETLLRKAGLASADFNLGALYDIPVPGYGYATDTDLKSVLADLKQLFSFDLVESDGMLKARVRGDTTADQTISYLALGNSGGDSKDTTSYWKETRLQEADLPSSFTLNYFNTDDDFQQNTAHSKRISNPMPTMFSRQQVKIEASICLAPVDAKNIVNKVLYAQWSERTKHNTVLPWAYAYLDPSDLLSVSLADRNYFERLHSIEVGANYAIKAETYGQDSGVYISLNRAADGGGSGRVQTVQGPTLAEPFVFNTPLLRDTDDTGGTSSRYYTAVGNNAASTFGGATVYRSTNDQDYSSLYSETAACEWGTVESTTPSPPAGVWAIDLKTQIVVWPGPNTTLALETISDDLFLQGANPCLLGQGNVWELITFRDCVHNADGSWTISHLLRGQRGTEYAASTHQPGDYIVFLDSNTISEQADTLNAAGMAREFKAVGLGRSINATQAVDITYRLRDLMPYAPNDIRRQIDGGTGDITITWARRTRVGGGLADSTGTVPLNETSEAYEVYLLTGAYNGDPSTGELPSNIKRSFTGLTSPTVTYTAAMQSADAFVNTTATLHAVVYQVSSVAGRGFPGYRDISPKVVDLPWSP